MAEHRLFPYFLILGAGIVWGATFSLAMYLGVDESWSWLASEAGLAVTGIALGSGFAYLMFFTPSRRPAPFSRVNVPMRLRFQA